MAVGVGVDEQDDHVIEDAQRLGVVGREELVDRLHEHLGAQHLAGVQATVDPDDGLARASQLSGVLLRHILGQGQPAGDVLVAGQLAMVGRRRDDAHELRPAFLGDADANHLEAVRFLFELRPVIAELLVIRQAVIVAQVEAEEFLRRRDRRPRQDRRHRAEEGHQKNQAEDPANPVRTGHGITLVNGQSFPMVSFPAHPAEDRQLEILPEAVHLAEANVAEPLALVLNQAQMFAARSGRVRKSWRTFSSVTSSPRSRRRT